jgi:hypothetical protein
MYQRKSTGLYQPQRDLDLHFAPSTLLDEVAWQSSTLQTCFSTQLLESFVFFAQNAAELCQKKTDLSARQRGSTICDSAIKGAVSRCLGRFWGFFDVFRTHFVSRVWCGRRDLVAGVDKADCQ